MDVVNLLGVVDMELNCKTIEECLCRVSEVIDRWNLLEVGCETAFGFCSIRAWLSYCGRVLFDIASLASWQRLDHRTLRPEGERYHVADVAAWIINRELNIASDLFDGDDDTPDAAEWIRRHGAELLADYHALVQFGRDSFERANKRAAATIGCYIDDRPEERERLSCHEWREWWDARTSEALADFATMRHRWGTSPTTRCCFVDRVPVAELIDRPRLCDLAAFVADWLSATKSGRNERYELKTHITPRLRLCAGIGPPGEWDNRSNTICIQEGETVAGMATSKDRSILVAFIGE